MSEHSTWQFEMKNDLIFLPGFDATTFIWRVVAFTSYVTWKWTWKFHNPPKNASTMLRNWRIRFGSEAKLIKRRILRKSIRDLSPARDPLD